MKSVYLAGAISGLNFDGAADWRFTAQKFLSEHSINGMSPLRGKSYLRGRKAALSSTSIEEGRLHALSTPRGIMTRDFYDCTGCDLILVNLLGTKKVSIGTVMEIAWGYHSRTPIVCCMEEGNIHEHALINEAIGFRVPTLDEGLELCCAILNPGSLAEEDVKQDWEQLNGCTWTHPSGAHVEWNRELKKYVYWVSGNDFIYDGECDDVRDAMNKALNG